MMHGREKSGPAVVAVKRANKAERSAAESVEPRAGAEGNASQQSTRRAQNRESVSHTLASIRQAKTALPSSTRGGSRMRESRLYGSVRGALSNERPYRERFSLFSLDFIGALRDTVRTKIDSVPVSSHVFQQEDLGLAYRGALAPALDDL